MTIRSLQFLFAGLLLVTLLSACDSSEPTPPAGNTTEVKGVATAAIPASDKREFKAETIKVACGACIFDMEEAKGCPWAAEINGKHYLMDGNLPGDDDHDTHGEHGMCNVAREAVISGTLVGDTLTVTQMQIKPMPADS